MIQCCIVSELFVMCTNLCDRHDLSFTIFDMGLPNASKFLNLRKGSRMHVEARQIFVVDSICGMVVW